MRSKIFIEDASKFLQHFIKEKTNPHLVQFSHTITFGQNEISAMVSTTDIFKYYNKYKTPTICTDESGRILSEGIYLDNVLINNYKDCALIMPKQMQMSQKLGLNFGQHSLHVVQRSAGYQDFYSFYFDLSYTDFLHWAVNNGAYLNEFIEDYKLKAASLIQAAHAAENKKQRLHFSDYAEKFKPETLISFVHHASKLPVYLTVQQGKVLAYLFQGKTIKEIAKVMTLSDRTVEHYLAAARQILGCRSNRDLLIHYLEQHHNNANILS